MPIQYVAEEIQYTAEKDDLYYPAEHAVFFPYGRPQSEAGLCVELARLAYCQEDGASFAFDRPRISKVLSGVGFDQCTFFETSTNPQCKGSHALLAINSIANLAVLSFRGTDKDDPTDILDDLNALPQPWSGQGNVHTGFANAFLVLWNDSDENSSDGIATALSTLNGYALLFTGHSLGAAMATLAASLVKPRALYTFGSPRVGDQNFASSLAAINNFRYVDCCDVVTQLPPQTLGYEHLPGSVYYIDCGRAVRQRDPADSYIGADRTQAAADYLLKYAWRTGDVAVRQLADHTPANYVWPVTAAILRVEAQETASNGVSVPV